MSVVEINTNKTRINVEDLIEIKLVEPDNFLKVKETLTRIGVASKAKKELYQSCHILHKKQKYYLVHFKELFGLDGKNFDLSEEDKGRRNSIANLLAQWNLVTIVDPEKTKDPITPLNKIKVLAFKEKDTYTLISKYTVGSRRKKEFEKTTNS